MSELRYSLIFRGDLVPGYTATDVKANLARLFKAGPEAVEKLFSGRPLAIKKGLSQAQGEKLQATLAQLGAQATLKAEGELVEKPAAAPAPQAQESAPVQGQDWSLAPMQGNLVKEHERQKVEPLEVSVSHLSLKPAQGNLVDEREREPKQAVKVDVPNWKLD